jgi:ABC-type transport system involved in multi-copper enzyme maturation permease subunit
VSAAITSYRSSLPAGGDGFLPLLHAEWTKFRTVRAWMIAAAAGPLLIVLVAVLTGAASHSQVCVATGGAAGSGPQHVTCHASHPQVTLGPDGTPVIDQFSFVHQPLAPDGSITVRVSSLTGQYRTGVPAANPSAGVVSGVQQWAKVGVIVKENLTPGSPYAAVMVTGNHGVRMQYDYTHDLPGMPGTVSTSSPRWLRLTRSGDTLTGYDSTDGRHWTEIGSAHLTGLPATVQAGLFAAASADYSAASVGGPALATGVLDHVSLEGARPGSAWRANQVGNPDPGLGPLLGRIGSHQVRGSFTVTGSGDIAPNGDADQGVGHALIGAFVGMLVLIVLATLFITSEYRRGLIRTTFTACPRRGQVLAAKALVIGVVTFIAGLAGAVIAVPLGEHLLRSNGNYIYPASTLTQVRVIVGTAALLALAAVFALAVGAVLRRSAGAVTVVIAAIVLPYFLAVASVLPTGAGQWLLRITPAAAFAIQQTVSQYPQVVATYRPGNGYFPLAPWAGFAVLCGYALCAFAVAVFVLRRRDV